MKLLPLPRSRKSRLGAAALILVLLAAVVVRRDDVRTLVRKVFPERVYERAADRTSEPAPVGDALALPTSVAPAGETGTTPGISLAPIIELPGAASVVDLPGAGPVLISTLDGRVHEVDLDDGTTRAVLDLSDRVTFGGEQGLLGMTADPNGDRLYLSFSNDDGDTEIRSVALDADGTPVQEEGVRHLVVGQPYDNHNGGHVAFGPDGALWIGTGDGGGAGDPGGVAQDDTSLLGKMLRVLPDPAGGVRAPATNPDWARPEIWGIGLRNPWRYSFDRATGALWIADVGETRVEEVTVVNGDADRPNFGWDAVEGLDAFEGEPQADFTAPALTYSHDDGCSISGGYVYRGDNAGLHGWYLFADYCTGFIRAVPADDPGREPIELASDVGNVIGFGELEDGELVVLTATGVQRILPG